MLRKPVLAGLLALCLTAGCKAQTVPAAGAPGADLNRRIEILVRAQYTLPPDVILTIGERKASPMQGYDSLSVVLTRNGRTQSVDFLISKDNQKLAKMQTFDLQNDPIFHIDVAGRPVRGNPNAKVTVVNFDDLECPYCARMHQELFPNTLERYKDKVRFVYKDDPLTEIHPWAMHAAVNANCLAEQNGDVYWKYVDYLHSHGQEVNGENRDVTKSNAALDRIAKEHATIAKMDTAKLDACLAKQDDSKIRESSALAEKLGIDGTPAVFVNGEFVRGGAVPEQWLWAAIDRALKAAGEQPPADQPAAPSAQAKPAGQ